MTALTVRVESRKKGRYSLEIVGPDGVEHEVIETGSADGAFAGRRFLESALAKAQMLAVQYPKEGKPKRTQKAPKAAEAETETEGDGGGRAKRLTKEQKAEIDRLEHFETNTPESLADAVKASVSQVKRYLKSKAEESSEG